MDEQLVELKGEELTQTTSMNVCLTTHVSPNFTTYRALCVCGDPDHEQTLEIDYNEEFKSVELTIYHTAKTSELYGYDSYFQQLYFASDNFFVCKYALVGWWIADKLCRVKAAIMMLLTGRLTLESSYMMENKAHITSYINALHSALDRIDTK